MNDYRNLRIVLDDHQAKENQLEAEKLQKCDWKDPLDRKLYLQDRRGEKRRKLVNRLAPKSVCPYCGRFVMSLRSWVVSKKDDDICCRSCFASGQGEVSEQKTHYNREVFGDPIYRIGFNGFQLAAIREDMGIKLSSFARTAGWSNSYQHKLENKVKTISLEVAEVVVQTLERFGCTTDDCL